MTTQAEFPLFSRLPAELRNQIWQDALPDKIGQLLYFYKKGCWCPRRVVEGEQGYDPDNDELNLAFEFRHELLDPVKIDVPGYFVSRESHSISSAWVRGQGLKLFSRKDELIFVRPFHPLLDTLYVPLEKWNDFISEPYDRTFQPDLLYRALNCPGIYFTRIAIPRALLEKNRDPDPLPAFFDWYERFNRLFIVVNPLPELQPDNNDTGVQQQRWELEDMQGPMYFWNGASFEWQDGHCAGDNALYKRMEETSNMLIETLGRTRKDCFEVRCAVAVAK